MQTTLVQWIVLVAGLSLLTGCEGPQKTSSTEPSSAHIFYNGNFITMDPALPTAEAMAVQDGTIISIGTQEQVKTAISETVGGKPGQTDLGGKTVLPGFIDSHGHFMLTALLTAFENIASPPVGPVKNIDDIIDLLKVRKANTPVGEWILGHGYDDSLLAEGRHPTRKDLDKISTEHPVLLWHVSGHLSTCNSKCLEFAGINENTPNPKDGVIQRIGASNIPNGVLEEGAMFRLLPRLPVFSADASDSALIETQNTYASYGITTTHEGGMYLPSWTRLQKAASNSLLKIDLVAYAHYAQADQFMQADHAVGTYNNRLKLGGIKLMLDGSPQGKTAYLSQPYKVPPPAADASYRGYPALADEAVNNYVHHFFNSGWPVIAHANGDAAAEQLINAVSYATDKLGSGDRRTVMIHAQTVRDDQLDRMAELSMIPSFFVAHTFFWGDWHRDSVLGAERAKRISPLRSATERGLRYNIHNDTPVIPPHMTRLIWTAVNRTTRSGQTLGEAQQATVMEALKAVTIDAAYQYFEEESKGSLSVGKIADMVVLSANPLAVEKSTLDKIEVLATFKEGEIIFEKP